MSERASYGPVLVCFAVPDESRLFIAGLHGRKVTNDKKRHRLPLADGLLDGLLTSVVHTGVGDTPAARAEFARVLAGHQPRPQAVVSAGYAGGLHPDLAVGDIVLGGNYSSSILLERAHNALTGERFRVGKLLTVPDAIERSCDKADLHRVSGALAVDMETAWIAEACAASELPLLSLRVVSDAAGDDFPVPGRVLYDAVRQRPRYLALPAWLALHPGRIMAFARFVRALGPARQRLTHALCRVLARER